MVGRLYLWRGSTWRVVRRWAQPDDVRAAGYTAEPCPRNVLLVRMVPLAEVPRERYGERLPYARTGGGTLWCELRGAERVVRPFRGLRRLRP